ncbi:aminoacyl-tRNA hydrolase [Porphyromonadaceae bacterium OttesenSCG-928-L07]|nr:aminoacyl-tRNA hydrolase [Porphyromonadaceae bacterium OttesenSCG-928-L07]MDL2252086.1 aminoacyl-tRNA hydrolase [Odoribacter sp. OttesenSCG-928-J03]MDL2330833.1 aminoacyl-tRNA hydrolase [Odoribacter sp. OttesenSCG-928-A06]
MKYLIVGLGNIGPEYEDTRHNSGFKVLDAFAKASNIVFESKRYGDVATLNLKGRKVVLLKPATYMNLSGKAVAYWMQKEQIALENILIITDDIALPFGTLRLRSKGSDGGHNGLKSINACLDTDEYARLRFGIGSEFSRGGQVNYVLGEWGEEEREKLPVLAERSMEIIKSFVLMGVVKTMNEFNKKN